MLRCLLLFWFCLLLFSSGKEHTHNILISKVLSLFAFYLIEIEDLFFVFLGISVMIIYCEANQGAKKTYGE